MSRKLVLLASATLILLAGAALFLIDPKKTYAVVEPTPNSSCNVHCRLSQHPTLKKIYKPTTPLFLDEVNAPNYFAKDRDVFEYSPIKRYLAHLTKLNKQANVGGTRHKSCAVVGSSQNLSGSEYGARIDAHDAVFRINMAPIKGYEKDVGAKTTYRLFHAARLQEKKFRFPNREPFKREQEWLIFYPDWGQGETIFSLAERYDRRLVQILKIFSKTTPPDSNTLKASRKKDRQLKDKYPQYLKTPYLKKLSPKHILEIKNHTLFLHPAFRHYLHEGWFGKTTEGFPSSGFIGIITALHMCDEVDAFGFGMTPDGFWGYYYEKATKKRRVDWHNPSYQEKFLDELHDQGVITLDRGVTQSP
jgi:hypothetical protein